MPESKSKGGPKKKGRGAAGQRSSTGVKHARAASDPTEASRPERAKDGKLYHRIGEVSRITGVKPYVLRYWEGEFRWMSPQKSRSKQRLYRPKDIEVILLIKKLLYEERYTIAGARQKLRELMAAGAIRSWVPEKPSRHEPGSAPGDSLKSEVAEAEACSDLAVLREIREELQSIRRALEA